MPSPTSGKGLPGALPGGVGEVAGSGGGAEEATCEALCGGPAAAGLGQVRQEKHCHGLWTGED